MPYLCRDIYNNSYYHIQHSETCKDSPWRFIQEANGKEREWLRAIIGVPNSKKNTLKDIIELSCDTFDFGHLFDEQTILALKGTTLKNHLKWLTSKSR